MGEERRAGPHGPELADQNGGARSIYGIDGACSGRYIYRNPRLIQRLFFFKKGGTLRHKSDRPQVAPSGFSPHFSGRSMDKVSMLPI